jgi:hypothetical protein
MAEKKEKIMKNIDENGNTWVLSMKPQEKYPNRHELGFSFNGINFVLQYFVKSKDADNFWELLNMLTNNKGGENAKTIN